MKSNKKKHFLMFAVQTLSIVLLIVLDQIFKNIAVEKLADGKLHTVINGFLGFIYAENTGAAFSMFTSSTALLSVVTGVLIVAGMVYLAIPMKKAIPYEICIPLIIAGGAGNLYDRLTRGFVVDFIDALFVNFPVFNFADCLITCGAIALIIYLIYEIFKEAKAEKKVVKTVEIKPDGESDE